MCAYEILTSLMEWCPYIVVCDGAYNRIKNLQITPDVVIGDFDSLKGV
jgi:thiamine pyrophosphokinase